MSEVDTFCDGTGRVMLPGFQTSFSYGQCILFLFPGFVLNTAGLYALGLLLSFCMGFSNEVFLYARKYLTCFLEGKPKFWRLSLGFLYALHMVLAYWIMLLVMTYEALIFVALILGLGVSHAVFLYIPSPKNNVKRSMDEKLIAGTSPCCGGIDLPK